MKPYRIKHVDAFTRTPFTGNYAGVVLDADGLSDEQMHLIAREKNVPETAFILSPTVKDADIRIRWFTPQEEVPLCGHATIAGFHALAEEGMAGMKPEGQHYFRLQTKSGILNVRVEKNFRGITVEFELPLPAFKVRKNLPAVMFKALGITAKDLEKKMPVVSESYLYIPLKKLATLESLKPDFPLLIKASKLLKVLGVSLLTLDTVEKGSSVHSRFFAPAVGINEDPVTGSANGPIGVYLYNYAARAGFSVRHRDLADGRIEYVGEQGDEVDRPGRVKIRLRLNNAIPESVCVAGEAITVMDSTLRF
ncbi:MAG: PhzF family phenazine biosynthesis protein [Bacteroidota bacterium]